MDFDKVYRDCVDRVWSEDGENQTVFLNIVQQARNCSGIDFRQLKSIFIPNDKYLRAYSTSEIMNPAFGVYNESGLCFWNNCVVFPIYNVADKIVSLVGFNPLQYAEAKETGDKSINYYCYSPKNVFAKGRYLFYTEGAYTKSVKDGYALLTDGIFDTISLSKEGFNAMAFMGSSITPEIAMLLRFVSNVIIVSDNDSAGAKLVQYAKSVLSGVKEFRQGKTKDIDELLKSEFRTEVVQRLKAMIGGCVTASTFL